MGQKNLPYIFKKKEVKNMYADLKAKNKNQQASKQTNK